MSQNSATAFLDKVDADTTLQEKLKGLGANAKFEDLQDVAALAGYKFTQDELVDAGKARLEAKGITGQELSETELEQVAGGIYGVTVAYSPGTLRVTIY